MKLLRSRSALLVAGLFLQACRDPAGPLVALNEAQRRWAAYRPPSYSYTLVRHCFCAPEFARPSSVLVVNGSVTDVRFVDDGTQVRAELRDRYPTIDQLFEIIRAARDGNAYQLLVTYHPELGYPTQIRIDYQRLTADDEITYLASDVVPVAQARSGS